MTSWVETVSLTLPRRRRAARVFALACRLITWSGVVLLGVLLVHVSREGFQWLDWDFLTSFPSRFAERAGIKSALMGTLWLIGGTGAVSIPLGVAASIYLEEYARPGRIKSIIEINIANLAGVPSIVYGILGLALFVRGMALGRSVAAGALTMSLLILPVIVITSREAIRAVPGSIRQAAFALGATRWQVTRDHVLPAALPGILTGVILAMSRAIGETAPLIMIGALTYVAFLPRGPADSFTALLVVLFVMNGVAVYIRNRSQRKPQ
jgi:phosphate transport system permease protein